MIWHQGDLILTDSLDKVDTERVYELLQLTYWAIRRPRELVEKMIRHSLCFSLLDGNRQVGFARIVTDYTVFSWLADVVLEPAYRNRGLGQWMVSCILKHPALSNTQFVLQTRDAHTLYERYGFSQNPALMSTRVSGL
jgi:GNAT superfamily N-acetyltransferase